MPQITALDWGTSSFRGYLLDENGTVCEKIRAEAGILTVQDGDFGATLRAQLLRFKRREPRSPIIASGMITSRNGWLETPYLCCPVGMEDLAGSLEPMHTDEFGTIWFVTGVNQFKPEPDIMRGEETQLAGLVRPGKITVILPGTHSKWVSMNAGYIENFTTFMTGDVYKAVLESTILKASPVADWSQDAFLNGVKAGFKRTQDGRSMLSGLFQVRVNGILGMLPEEQIRSYLSGMLIGAEIAEGVGAGRGQRDPFVVLGDAALTSLYLDALDACELSGEPGPADVVATGLYRLARQRALV